MSVSVDVCVCLSPTMGPCFSYFAMVHWRNGPTAQRRTRGKGRDFGVKPSRKSRSFAFENRSRMSGKTGHTRAYISLSPTIAHRKEHAGNMSVIFIPWLLINTKMVEEKRTISYQSSEHCRQDVCHFYSLAAKMAKESGPFHTRVLGRAQLYLGQ